jgi:hypothetical protein
MESLLFVAERDGPEMFARIAMMKALYRVGEVDSSGAPEAGQGYRIIR